jgi:hypothetical protein
VATLKDLAEFANVKVRANGGRGDISMAERFLDHPQVSAILG